MNDLWAYKNQQVMDPIERTCDGERLYIFDERDDPESTTRWVSADVEYVENLLDNC